MRAKCPHCNDGCEKCEAGYVQASFAGGQWYARRCQNPECGFDNGARAAAFGLPDIDRPCVICGGTDMVWIPAEIAVFKSIQEFREGKSKNVREIIEELGAEQ